MNVAGSNARHQNCLTDAARRKQMQYPVHATPAREPSLWWLRCDRPRVVRQLWPLYRQIQYRALLSVAIKLRAVRVGWLRLPETFALNFRWQVRYVMCGVFLRRGGTKTRVPRDRRECFLAWIAGII
jgi:hypothetical protein